MPTSRSGRATCRTIRSSMNASRPCTAGCATAAARPLRRHRERRTMTAPLKNSDAVIVDVALGSRAYDIVIGRDVLASLGARVAALRPGVRTAIVTDRTVAKYWLEHFESSLAGD